METKKALESLEVNEEQFMVSILVLDLEHKILDDLEKL